MTPRPNITKIEIEIIHVFKKITDLEWDYYIRSHQIGRKMAKNKSPVYDCRQNRGITLDMHLFQRTFWNTFIYYYL